MSNRFIKFIPSEKALWLASKHPNAFILLMFIAERARRNDGHPDGLKSGEAHIGDWENMGLSRQNYRTALKVLVSNNFLKILETNRTRKKSTTGITTEGTKVKLLNSDIWDININEDNHRPNHCLTTDQPLPNHEQECKERKKKDKKKQNFMSDSIEVGLVNFFYDQLLKLKSDFKKPNVQIWAKTFDYLIRIDGKSPEKIKQLISWCMRDEFECKNVLSPFKLRTRWDDLELRMNKPNKINQFQINKELAEKAIKYYYSKVCELKLEATNITFIPQHTQTQVYSINFNENDFKQKLINELKIRQFKQIEIQTTNANASKTNGSGDTIVQNINFESKVG